MKQIEVTPTQNEYLKELATGPKTTRDLVLSFMVSAKSIGKMMSLLRDKGLVTSSRRAGAHGNARIHELTAPYSELNLVVKNRHKNIGITEEEILYAAILRNEGMTGHQLTDQYRKEFPHRRHRTILSVVVTKARNRGLCR